VAGAEARSRRKHRWRWSTLALAAALASASLGGARAQPAAPPSGTVAPAPSPDATKPYEVEGFRSAKFGMDEAAVKRAIVADFGIREAAIAKETNPIDRTLVLSATVKDVLPEVATARVYYILGYSQKKLFQVVLMWGQGVSDTPPNAPSVFNAAQLLLNYFVGLSFKPENRIVNAQLADGMTLLFQGIDDRGREVQLQFGTAPHPPREGETVEEGKPPPRSPFARVVYVEDPKNLDIYRIKPGQF
jgi:hypothetical protein